MIEPMIDYRHIHTKNAHALAIVRARDFIREQMLGAEAPEGYEIADLIIKKRGAKIAVTWVLNYVRFRDAGFKGFGMMSHPHFSPSAAAPSDEWFERMAKEFNSDAKAAGYYLTTSDNRDIDDLTATAIYIAPIPADPSAHCIVEDDVMVRSNATADDVKHSYGCLLMQHVEAVEYIDDEDLEALLANPLLSDEDKDRVCELADESELERQEAENAVTISALYGLRSHEDAHVREQAEDLMGTLLMSIAAG